MSFNPKKGIPEKMPVPISNYHGTGRFVQKAVRDREIIVKRYNYI